MALGHLLLTVAGLLVLAVAVAEILTTAGP